MSAFFLNDQKFQIDHLPSSRLFSRKPLSKSPALLRLRLFPEKCSLLLEFHRGILLFLYSLCEEWRLTFMNFVKNHGAEPKPNHRQSNSYREPSHLKRTYFPLCLFVSFCPYWYIMLVESFVTSLQFFKKY